MKVLNSKKKFYYYLKKSLLIKFSKKFDYIFLFFELFRLYIIINITNSYIYI